jgi:hypothetical protein
MHFAFAVGVTRRTSMNIDVHKPRKRRGLMSRIKSWLRRPGTFKAAQTALKIVTLIAKVFDLF